MSEKHTPGPWRYVRDGDYWEIKPTGIGGKDNGEGNEADYHLVAAAPLLLEAAVLNVGVMKAIIAEARQVGEATAFLERLCETTERTIALARGAP